MRKNKFFFIVFEGVEGTGKSYQIKKLYNNLKKLGYNLHKTREPGGSKNAERIRKTIFEKKKKNFHKITDFYLMLAARNEHLNETILNAKKQKKIFICDRFTDSTYAYQVIGNKIEKNINYLNNRYILGKIRPHIVIVLKSSMKKIFQRLKKRKHSNKFDKLEKKFYTKVQHSFLNIAKSKKNYYIFDSSNNDNVLEKKIISLIRKKIKG